VSDVIQSPAELEASVRTALQRTVVALADSKRLMGIRYSDWLLGAPSLETGIAASSMAQDEWGHARLLYSLLKEFDLDPVSVEHDRQVEEYASLPALDEPFSDWAAVVAAVTLVDGGLTVFLEGLAEGAWESARSRMPKMVAEEAFHASMGRAWFRRLSQVGGEGRERLVSAATSMLPGVLALLDPGDDDARLLAEAGIVPSGMDLRARYLGSVADLLAEIDLTPPPSGDTPTGWDPARRRTAGSPGLEAVERARGDLNRELFVE
jgi:ring-1,2-phenylacetyl-CoA epoxidase subunit PaaC